MHPITGPQDTRQRDPRGAWYRYRRSYRQRKPYNLPLPFVSQGGRTLKATNAVGVYDTTAYGATCNPAWCRAGFPNAEGSDGTRQFLSAISSTRSIARERFNSKLRDTAEIGAAVAQYGQSVDMIANRALQIYRFTKALRRFDFPGAARELNHAVYGKDGAYYRRTMRGNFHRMNLRRESRAFASNFLEYSFGWAPLVSDVSSAVDILGSPQRGTKKVTARARANDTFTGSTNNGTPWAPVIMIGQHQFTIAVICEAEVEVTNPNLSLASQLGFVNPVSIAWEVMPFSFVIDYFVNVQSYLENYTSLFGLGLTNVWSTTYVKDICDLSQTWWDGRPGNYVTSDYYRVERSNSLPEVTLRQKQFALPLGRALTSVSLLTSLGIKR